MFTSLNLSTVNILKRSKLSTPTGLNNKEYPVVTLHREDAEGVATNTILINVENNIKSEPLQSGYLIRGLKKN